MAVRRATEADTPALLEMGRQFYATTLYPRFAAYNVETVTRLIGMMRDMGVLLVFESEGRLRGLVGLLVAPFLFDANVKAAYEVIWWVEPSAQGAGIGAALLAGIEPACRESGCVAIQMVALASSPPQARQLYERLGYESSEFCHTKVLQERS